MRNTILHEIAHALTGHKAGHNAEWRNMAIAIGCDGQRVYNHRTDTLGEVMRPTLKRRKLPTWHRGTCPGCKRVVVRRYRRGIACGLCCRKFAGGKYDDRFKIDWSKRNG